VARGLLDRVRVDAVNARVSELLGPFATIEVCEHGPDAGCRCRKPAPGMVLAAATTLGLSPRECAVIGDIGADVDAARAAGARGILVPTAATETAELAAAAVVCRDLGTAVAHLLGTPR
jgi:HAD superfamily hydrolase (TIGR01662 family)